MIMDCFDSVSPTAINTSNADKKHVVDVVDLNVLGNSTKVPFISMQKDF